MRRIRLFLLACTVALSSIVWSAGPVAAAADNEVYYLALGDSLAVGYQPDGTVLNRAVVSKLGVKIGDITLKISRRPEAASLQLHAPRR